MASPIDRAQSRAVLSRGSFLHASAVCVEGKGFVFLAPSSGGKSTIAVKLISYGYVPLDDDRTIVCRNTDGKYMVHASAYFVSRIGWRPKSCPLYCFIYLEKGSPCLLLRLKPKYAFFRGLRDNHLIALEDMHPMDRRQAFGDFMRLLQEVPCFVMRSGLSSNVQPIIERILREEYLSSTSM